MSKRVLLDESGKFGTWARRLAWVPIPVLTIAIALLWAAKPTLIYESRWLVMVLNVPFTLITGILVAFLVGRSFVMTGARGLLLLGCGVIFWGASAVVAVATSSGNVNQQVTIHNICVCLAGACHLAGAVVSSRKGRPLPQTGWWLVVSYLLATGGISLVVMAAQQGWLPTFFIPGQGGTPMRQLVVGSAVVMFGATAWLLTAGQNRPLNAFVYWYSLALLLAAVGLFGLLFQSVTGSLLNWTSRGVQVLGGVYMLVAALASARQSGVWSVSLEAALREVEARYRLLFDLSRDGIVLHAMSLDPAECRFLQVNPAICELLGYTPEELLQLSPMDIQAAPERLNVEQEATRMAKQDRLRFEKKLVRKDGTLVETEINTSIFEQAGRRYVVSSIRDITDRKRTEAALRESEERLSIAKEAAALGIHDYDVTKGTIIWDARVRDIWGIGPDEPVTFETFMAGLHPDDRTATQTAVTQAFDPHSDGKYYAEYRVRSRGGGVERWVASTGQAFFQDGKAVRLIGTVLDITARKQAEAALRESKERFRLMGDTIAYGAWMADAQGRNIYISPLFLKLIGRTFEEVKEFGWTDKMPPEDVEPVMRRWMECVRTGQDWEGELRFPSPDGHWHTILSRGKPVRDSRGQVQAWVGINLDITGRKQAEEAVAAANLQLQSVIDGTTSMIYACDLEERFVMANTALAALLKTTPEQMIGKRRHEFMPQADADAHEAADRKVAAAGRTVEFEEHSDLHGRSITWLSTKFPLRDAQGRIYGVAGIVTDISERKKAEAALRESELFYRQMLESIPGMVFTTRADGYCDYQSRQWVDYTGIPMAEHLGDGWNRLLHPEDRPRAFAAWRAAVEERAPYDLEYRVRRHDGAFQWFKVVGRPICDASGQIVRWFGVALNIEALKQAEEELRAALLEKEVMLKEIHHRVKNNLQIISSLVDLQAAALNDPALREVFAEVRNRVRSMALVHEKLYQSDNLARVDFGAYARSLLTYLWRAQGAPTAHIQLHLDLHSVGLSVEQAVPCGLILNEMATNVLKHAFHGRSKGEVRVSFQASADGRVCLRVSDNGVGLPADLDWRQSRSLGLRLIQMLAKQLKATIEVKTSLGTEFQLHFEPRQLSLSEEDAHE